MPRDRAVLSVGQAHARARVLLSLVRKFDLMLASFLTPSTSLSSAPGERGSKKQGRALLLPFTHAHTRTPHTSTMTDYVLPDKWSEDLLDEAGQPMSKR